MPLFFYQFDKNHIQCYTLKRKGGILFAKKIGQTNKGR